MSKTSIVILTHNHLDYTKICLKSIRLYTSDYEIIIVDNASTDDTAKWLKEQNDLITIFNTENKGFPAGCNQGILKANGEVIVLLNNDTIVTPRWLDNLLICLNSSEEIGVVGPCSNHGEKFIQHTSIKYDMYNFNEVINLGEEFNVSNPKLWQEEILLSGFCLAIKKIVINKVGLLDEYFSPAYYEDADYCIRVRQAGYKLKFCADTFVNHFCSVTGKNMPGTSWYYNAILPNRKKFMKKWGFHPRYDCDINFEVVSFLNKSDSLRNIRVLEIGCACGATLLKIKYFFPDAELFGIEKNQDAARVAQGFAEIKIGDAEKMDLDYPYNYFDYILLPHTLDTLIDPWNLLSKLKKYLKPNGQIISSIFNVMNFWVIVNLLGAGKWEYKPRDDFDRTKILRFFTLTTILEMFENSGYLITQVKTVDMDNIIIDEVVENFIKNVQMITSLEIREDLLPYKYVIKAQQKF